MAKYMLTVQHSQQKVAYLEFLASDDSDAKTKGEQLFKLYQSESDFRTKAPYITGNFSGAKPPITNHWVSKWLESETAINAWGQYCGGYWETLQVD